VIVIFGASTDIGVRLAQRLLEAGLQVRPISRQKADLETGDGLAEAIADSTVVVSCAHARHTQALLNAVPKTVEQIICTGSAWRYSAVKNSKADEVRQAEKQFLSSGRNGVMLHPTMIYGGNQERNIQRLLALIRKMPLIPAPGGGRQIVQPIYVDDVVASLFSAIKTAWDGPNILPIAGPPLQWREMVAICADAIGCKRNIVTVPLSPILVALSALNRMGINVIDSNVVRRFREDVKIPLGPMRDRLSVEPRDFRTGIALAVQGWQRNQNRAQNDR
jgi:nucleoside-diphosphate-sugar epimerase